MSIKARIKITKDYYKKNGIAKTLKKVKYKSVNFIKNRKKHKINAENYKLWIEKNEPNEAELEQQRNHSFEYEPKISVVVPMYNTKELFLKDIVDSMLKQTYKNWELCLADGSPKKLEYYDKYINKSDKIKYKFLNENKGISGNTNRAIEMATGEYIALLDHDDLLPAFSLYEIVKTINSNRDAEFLYTDEDKIYDGKRIDPHFKPDYAPDTLMSYNYICHFAIYKKELLERTGLLNSEFDGSQDYDIILRACENAKKIVHIPKILYNWRMNEDSVALNSSAKPYAYVAAKKAIKAHLDRIGEEAEVVDSDIVGIYNVNYKIKGNPKVSIIISNIDDVSKLDGCIKSICKKTNYKNFEIIIVNNKDNDETSEESSIQYNGIDIKRVYSNEDCSSVATLKNLGVKNSDGEYIIFIDSHIKIISSNWIETLLGNCQRKDVGVVGAKILLNNSLLEHVGIILDNDNVVSYVSRGVDACESGYMARNNIIQNYNAVSGKLLIISRNSYEEAGLLDESLSDEYANIDLCFKLRASGKVNVLNPLVVVNDRIRHNDKDKEKEKQDKLKIKIKWSSMYGEYDSYYNPNFRTDIPDMSIKAD